MAYYTATVLRNLISVEVSDIAHYRRAIFLGAFVVALGFLVLFLPEISNAQRLTTAAVIFVAYPVIIKRGNNGLKFNPSHKTSSRATKEQSSILIDVATALQVSFFAGIGWLFYLSIRSLMA